MTKMPDKIYVTPPFGSSTEAIELPQPVTDEAKAKALAWVNWYFPHLLDNLTSEALEVIAPHYDTIKAALSQPLIPAQDVDAINSKKLGLSTLENLKLPDEEDVLTYSPSCCDQRFIDGHNYALSLPEVKRAFELAKSKPNQETKVSENKALEPKTSETVTSNQEQPEAIQKVVEALTPITKILGVAPIDSEACSYYAGHLRDAVNAAHTAIGSLRAHQSELEAQQDHIKYLETVIIGHEMENADLRRAVVDLDEALSSVLEESGSGKTLTQVHYKDLITKAKAVQS